ncbi:MAG: sugar phosphate isomerase/epimerase [Defluviitaleaceae bacterium]|nr:sugar phosphate isomerase/epimerase [Defluviitaleaceae bacterium]
MYFSMDEIGFGNTEKIKRITSEADRWRFIYDTAKAYGFDGVHITPSLYNDDFGLDLLNIPNYFQDFKLTLHFGGFGRLVSEDDFAACDRALVQNLEVALRSDMHDISIHPPNIMGLSPDEKKHCLELFHRAVTKWLGIALKSNLSLSLETHVTGKYFLFDGLGEYVRFIENYPDLGVLIDISHNYYDGYSEDEIISHLVDKNVKCLHISDAVQGAEFKAGTHLPVGRGGMDIAKILTGFAHIPGLCSVLEIKADSGDIGKSLELLQRMIIKRKD